MCDVDVLLPELLSQALRQSAGAELASGERARDDVAAQTRGRTGEDQRAALAIRLLDVVLLEREDRTPGECKGRGDARLEAVLHVLGRDLEEGLPHAVRSIKHGRADSVFGLWEFGVNCLPRGGDVLV